MTEEESVAMTMTKEAAAIEFATGCEVEAADHITQKWFPVKLYTTFDSHHLIYRLKPNDTMTEEESKAAKAISYLMAKCHNTAVKKGWWEKGARNDGELHMLIVTELAESFEHLRHDDRKSDHIPYYTGREEELADVLIRIFDYAKQQNLNLPGALIQKMKFNETREYRHGGKRA